MQEFNYAPMPDLTGTLPDLTPFLNRRWDGRSLGSAAVCGDERGAAGGAQAVIDGPRGALYGPFVPLIRSPELMTAAQRMGEYLRYRSAIGTRLTELAILVTARHWSQPVEWAIHEPIAREYGISDAMIAAIAARERRPPWRRMKRWSMTSASSYTSSSALTMLLMRPRWRRSANTGWWI
jgi:hypothetical protein